MEEKYLRSRALPIDGAAQQKIKSLINEYASRSEGHNYENYGNQIVIQKYALRPVYYVSLHSQYDTRPVKDKQYPYKGGSFAPRKYYNLSDVDVWDFKLLTTSYFARQSESFEVPGSHHVEQCGRCAGRGRVTCPQCGGSGDVRCSRCDGAGQIRKTRSEYRHTADKVYSDGHREPVYSYVNVTYYETCSNCHGSGRVECNRCQGRGHVQCPVCEGYGQNVHCYAIDQTLDHSLATHYFYDADVMKVQEFVDGKQKYKAEKLYHNREAFIRKGTYDEDPEIAGKLDSLLGQHSGKTGSNCHILFQEADVCRVDVCWVQYTYKGRTYDGCITVEDGKERFVAGVSPITELADKLLKEARRSVGGVGTVRARNLLERVEKLRVYGRDAQAFGIQSKVNTHLNTLYNLGNDLMFWLIALLGTPFLFNFYSELNPVMRYAHFVNDPAWKGFGWVPAVQCIVFLVLLWFAKSMINVSDHSKARHVTVFGYVFSGMGLYLLIAVGILAVLLGLNYLGLSALTSIAFYLVWQVVKVLLIILFYAIILAYMLCKWLFGLLGKLWAFLF